MAHRSRLGPRGVVLAFLFLPVAVPEQGSVAGHGQDGATPARVQGTGGGQRPTAAFTFAPRSPGAGQQIEFEETSTGSPTSFSWDFGDGTTAAGRRVTHVYTAEGTYSARLTVRNAFGSDQAIESVTVSGPGGGDPPASTPQVVRVRRQLEGVFLEGVDLDNELAASVEWNGRPGVVSFSVEGGASEIERGDPAGATHTFRMGRDFPVRFGPSPVRIVPTNAEGMAGPVWTEDVYVLPYPEWLEDALSGSYGAISFAPANGAIEARIRADFPHPHLAEDGPIDIPSWVPYLGGRFGLTETFARFDGEVSSLGAGRLELFGQTGFVAAGGEISGNASGAGRLRLFGDTGLEVTGASFSLGLQGTLTRTLGIVNAVPALRGLGSTPFVGGLIDDINDRVTLTGEISPFLEMDAVFFQGSSGDLRFREATGDLGLDLRATVRADVYLVEVQGWVAGAGTLHLAVPRPFVRSADLRFEVGASLTYFFFGSHTLSRSRGIECSWVRGADVSCGTIGSDELLALLEEDPRVILLDREYELHGPYADFRPTLLAKAAGPEIPVATRQHRLVSNVFPAGGPAYAGTADKRLLLWEHQDLGDPVPQSTEIAWSLFHGGSWSRPEWIADDTQAELRPVAAVVPEEKVAAAWLRVKDPAFDEPIDRISDLPKFNRQLEVVGSAFDLEARTWDPVVSLTDDASFDHDLRISSDGRSALLTWLSNPAGELLSSAGAPSRLVYSEWDPTAQAWRVPLPIAGGLVGAGQHAAAMRGDHAVVLLERSKPDGEKRLEAYERTGHASAWEGPTTFAGAGDNYSPQLAFGGDGTLHVLWIRNGTLVQATWGRPAPDVVRPASASLGLLDARLLTNSAGNLTLVWREVGDEGPADVFLTIYDPKAGRWSADRRLTRGPRDVHAVSGFYDELDDLHLAYLSTRIERRDRTLGEGAGARVIPNVPSDGRTDLEVLLHSLRMDLALADSDLVSTPARPEPGERATARLTVHNAGDFTAEQVSVELRAEPAGPGPPELLAAADVGLLRAGEAHTVELPFVLPPGEWDLAAIVDPHDGIAEGTETNNRAVIAYTNRPPQAVIDPTPARGEAPLRVRFDAGSSSDPEGAPLSFRWSFGDGSDWREGAVVERTFALPGIYPVALIARDPSGGIDTTVLEIEVLTAAAPPVPDDGDFLASPEIPGFRFKVRITGQNGSRLMGRAEPDCVGETLCVSGALSGRSEVFLRLVGPKPNGFLWPTLVKFSTSTVEVWIEQVSTGQVQYYRLEGATPASSDLAGFFDRTGFQP